MRKAGIITLLVFCGLLSMGALFGGLDKSQNLADLSSAPTALTNLGLTATAAEINTGMDGITADADDLNALTSYTGTATDLLSLQLMEGTPTVTCANAAANTIDCTIQGTDAGANAFGHVVPLLVWLSDAATGAGGSAHTHSTAPSFTGGEEITEFITNDSWLILTATNGVAVLRLVDTGNEDVTVNVSSLTGIRSADTTVAGDWSS